MTPQPGRSEEHTSELQSHLNLVCRLLLEKKKYDIVSYVQMLTSNSICDLVARTRVCVYRSLQCSSYALTNAYESLFCYFFFFNDTATTEIYTLSLHDALPI